MAKPMGCCSALLMLSLSTCALAQHDRSLEQLESQVQRVCSQVIESVVSVDGASGVVISSDGIILTEFHVSHARFAGDTQGHPLGYEVPVVFADGRKTTATLLGADAGDDFALVKLPGDGPYVFSELRQDSNVELGDWVIKFGHPRGYRDGRPPVARLGRVIRTIDTEFIADCHTVGGDSGGPYFDLEGKVVGMLHTASVPRPKLPQELQVRTEEAWAATRAHVIATRIPSMMEGEVTRELAARWAHELYASERQLPFDLWKHGKTNLSRWKDIAAEGRVGVVKVFDGSRQVALGTIVDNEGRFVTRASAIHERIRYETAEGEVLKNVSVVGVNPAYDIAVLRTESPTEPTNWATSEDLRLGTFQAAVGQGDLPFAIGIVSVAPRRPTGPFLKKIIPEQRIAAEPPEICGISIEGRGLVIVSVDGKAAETGLEPADELIKLGSTMIRIESDIVKAIEDRVVGAIIVATVLRDSKKIEFDVPLDSRSQPKPRGQADTRADSMRVVPVMYEHDAPVAWHECGGPLLSLDGKVTGVTIARLGAYGGIAIPVGQLRKIVDEIVSE